ncbi:hypothetical protein Anapl_08171 [Anas platyrhynchos]|uniref:Uncharacterized protein n=1 Tax=Anas platyrhynchos TaxID=8839 RepID=R0LRR1_ANAPL|nr:hypothetical protein Anapl_08171 [Anas platyrhynchos]
MTKRKSRGEHELCAGGCDHRGDGQNKTEDLCVHKGKAKLLYTQKKEGDKLPKGHSRKKSRAWDLPACIHQCPFSLQVKMRLYTPIHKPVTILAEEFLGVVEGNKSSPSTYQRTFAREGTERGSPAVEDSWALVGTGRELSVLVAVNNITSSSVTVSEVAHGWTPLGEMVFHQQTKMTIDFGGKYVGLKGEKQPAATCAPSTVDGIVCRKPTR